MLNRRIFLKSLVVTAAGVLIPQHVAAEPERRVWALDRDMLRSGHASSQLTISRYEADCELVIRLFAEGLDPQILRLESGQYQHTFFTKQPLQSHATYRWTASLDNGVQ
jgi:hypothetical protein